MIHDEKNINYLWTSGNNFSKPSIVAENCTKKLRSADHYFQNGNQLLHIQVKKLSFF